MVRKIYILGASGVGTSTLGKALEEKLNYYHLDTDDYYWLPPPKYSFIQARERVERQNLLMNDLKEHDNWILSGSLCGWGDVFIPFFDVAIYLWIPEDIRIKRLIEREKQRYGEDIEPGGNKYNQFLEFIEWSAFIYDESIKNSYTNVYPNAKVYSLTVRPKIDKEFQRLIDFNYGRRLKQQVHYYHQLI